MRPVIIPIFWKSEDSAADDRLEDLGIPTSPKPVHENLTRNMTFFNPGNLAINSYEDWNIPEDQRVPIGRILFNGNEFLTPLTEEQLTKVIVHCMCDPTKRTPLNAVEALRAWKKESNKTT